MTLISQGLTTGSRVTTQTALDGWHAAGGIECRPFERVGTIDRLWYDGCYNMAEVAWDDLGITTHEPLRTLVPVREMVIISPGKPNRVIRVIKK